VKSNNRNIELNTIHQCCSQGQNAKAKDEVKALTLKVEAEAKAWILEAKIKTMAWTLQDQDRGRGLDPLDQDQGQNSWVQGQFQG